MLLIGFCSWGKLFVKVGIKKSIVDFFIYLWRAGKGLYHVNKHLLADLIVTVINALFVKLKKNYVCLILNLSLFLSFFSSFLSVSPVNNLEQALSCALTYLLFHEGEEFMTENVEHYTEMLGHERQPHQVCCEQNCSSC